MHELASDTVWSLERTRVPDGSHPCTHGHRPELALGRCLSAASVWIMNDLDALAEEYDRRLRLVCGYVGMPDMSRLDTAYNALLLVAAGLETSDPGLFVELVPIVIRKRMAHGVTIEAVQQALTRLAEMLEPQLPSSDFGGYTGEVANFLWRAMSDVHGAFFHEALARLRSAEEQLERTEESLHELERLTRALSHEGWQAFWARAGSVGYRFDPGIPAGEPAYSAGVVAAGDFWAPEVGEAARRKAFVLPASGGRSMAVAPLKAYARGEQGYTGEDGLFVGVLGVDDDPGNPLSPEDLELVRSAAQLVAQALESTRLFEETQRRVHEANMLFNVSRALASAPLEAGEIGEIIVRQFVEVMGISEAAISLLNPKDGMLYVTADFVRGDEAGGYTGEAGGYTGEGMRSAGAPARPFEIPTVYRLTDYPATMAAMETLQPLVVQASDPNADPAELAFMSKYGRKTRVILPLAIKGRSIGILELESWDKEYRYTPEQIDLAMTLANQAAVALENARLFEETQAALAEVQAAHRSYLRQEWGEHLRQQEILERSGLMYDHPQAGGVGDTAPGVLGSTVPKETTGVEALAGRAVLVPGLWRPEMERAVVEGGPIAVRGGNGDEERASLAVPITLRGQTLGVIGVESPAGDRQWTDDEVALIEAVGEQLGQALETARLFADTQRRAERERLVGEITAKIRASTDVRAILQTTAVELGELLGTSRTLVRLTQSPGGTPEDEGRR